MKDHDHALNKFGQMADFLQDRNTQAAVGYKATVQELINTIGSYGRIAYFPSRGEYRIITQAEPTVVDAQMITHLLTEGLLARDGRTYQLTHKGRGMLRA